MTPFRKLLRLLCLMLLPFPAIGQEAVADFGRADARRITLRSTTDIAVLRPAVEAFVRQNPDLAVHYEQWGSNDLYLMSRRDCAVGQSGADALLSSGVHQMVDLVNASCASPYRSPQTQGLPPARIWRDEVWGVTREAAVIVYNRALVRDEDVPQSRFELLDLMRRDDPAYRGKIATYDVEASGLGYLFAFSDSLEATTFGALLEGFARAEAVATCCSAHIISGVASGRYRIAYNVLGSYAGTVDLDNIGIVHPTDYTLYLSRAYLIPRSAHNKAEAARLLDFLLSGPGQQILSETGLVTGPGGGQALTSLSAGSSSDRVIGIDPTLLIALDQQRRERFIDQWRKAFQGP